MCIHHHVRRPTLVSGVQRAAAVPPSGSPHRLIPTLLLNDKAQCATCTAKNRLPQCHAHLITKLDFIFQSFTDSAAVVTAAGTASERAVNILGRTFAFQCSNGPSSNLETSDVITMQQREPNPTFWRLAVIFEHSSQGVTCYCCCCCLSYCLFYYTTNNLKLSKVKLKQKQPNDCE